MLLSYQYNSRLVKIWIFFLLILLSEIVKKPRIFHPKTINFQKNKIKKFSLEEHVLLELGISVDLIILFSSFKVY